MKKIIVFLILSLISVFSFAGCAYFQLANDCNGNSTTVTAKNDVASVDIHANWKQGNISYKFQSGPEKLDMTVYANDMTRLYTQLSYKNKSVLMYYDFNLGQLTTDDEASLQTLLQSLNPTFLENIQNLASELPKETANLEVLQDIAYSLVYRDGQHYNFGLPWKYIYFSLCLIGTQNVNCCHCMWIVEKTHAQCVNLGDCSPSSQTQ